MLKYKTLYGEINNSSFDYYHNNEVLKECQCQQKSILQTPVGACVPKYDRGDVRAKNRNSLSFYKSGKLKSIYLQNQTTIQTLIGLCEAELITFYENEMIHRVFPRYGQISGYWSEEEELELIDPFIGTLNGIMFQNKITSYCFYPSGKLKSITLAKGDEVIIDTPVGKIKARIGISFYEDGSLASLEPSQPETVNTSIGFIVAYDNAPLGIHGDQNSMKFTKEGGLLSLKTIMTGVELKYLNAEEHSENILQILPERKRSMIDIDQFEMVPIEISFIKNGVEIIDSNGKLHRFSMLEYQMKSIYNPLYRHSAACGNCESCNRCG